MAIIKFETNNAAFVDDFHGEVTAILNRVKSRVRHEILQGDIRDTNGNKIGFYDFEQNK